MNANTTRPTRALRFRNRLDVLVLDDRIEATQVGLLSRKTVWRRRADRQYYLLTTYRDHDSAESMVGDPKGGGLSKAARVRVASIDIVDDQSRRIRLIKRFNGWEPTMKLAKLIADKYSFPPPVVIDLAGAPDEESAFRESHLAFLESL